MIMMETMMKAMGVCVCVCVGVVCAAYRMFSFSIFLIKCPTGSSLLQSDAERPPPPLPPRHRVLIRAWRPPVLLPGPSCRLGSPSQMFTETESRPAKSCQLTRVCVFVCVCVLFEGSAWV